MKKEDVLEHKVIVTYEAIYDIVEAEEYIYHRFGEQKAVSYRNEIYSELNALSINAGIYASSGFEYRGYTIYKKPFPPAIIFWVIMNGEVHVLRIPREEYNWQRFFEQNQEHEYTYPQDGCIQ